MTDPMLDLGPPDKMYEHHRQQLSAMLDGALSPDAARFMLRRLRHDSDLAACWERWQVCGDILRGQHHALLPQGFAQSVSNAIAQEDAADGVAVATESKLRLMKWGGGAALAASVAIAALFVARQPSSPLQSQPDAAAAQIAIATTPTGSSVNSNQAIQRSSIAPNKLNLGATAVAATATAVVATQMPQDTQRRSRVRTLRASIPRQSATLASIPASAAPTPSGEVSSPSSAVATSNAFVQTDPVLIAPTRAWPRAALSNVPTSPAFMANYTMANYSETPWSTFHPFEPQIPFNETAAKINSAAANEFAMPRTSVDQP